MRLAIVLPAGPLDRFGYQHIFAITLANQCAFADRVYLVSSTRNRAGVDGRLSRHRNLVVLSDETTWFGLDAQGEEVFSVGAVERNVNRALEAAREDGMDCALQLHVNQYVPASAVAALRERCRRMLADRRPFEWLYRRYQLRDRLFHADVRLPWILDASPHNPFRFATDSIRRADTGERHAMEIGDYAAHDGAAIVDCSMEMTLEDLRDVRTFTRFYAEMNPDAPTAFDPEVYLEYYTRKFRAKRPSDEPLDDTGRAIAGACRPEFLSNRLLETLACGRGEARRRRRAGALVRRCLRVAQWPALALRSVRAGLAAARHRLRLRRLVAGRGPEYREYVRSQFRRSWAKRHAPAPPDADALMRRLLSAQPPRDARVLCVGCRSQREIETFRRLGFGDVIGIDLFSDSPDIRVMDMHRMTFEDGRFGIVFSRHSLEHAHDPSRVAAEIVRVARDGAIVAVEVPVHFAPSGADRHDFGGPEGVLRLFGAHLMSVQCQESAAKGSSDNPCGTDVARVVFTVQKP